VANLLLCLLMRKILTNLTRATVTGLLEMFKTNNCRVIWCGEYRSVVKASALEKGQL
jgi:hypothetical protein